jgi:hypothetical protein
LATALFDLAPQAELPQSTMLGAKRRRHDTQWVTLGSPCDVGDVNWLLKGRSFSTVHAAFDKRFVLQQADPQAGSSDASFVPEVIL